MSVNRNRRWRRRPSGSNWGDFGEDDERGRLNLLTPARVRAGIAEVKSGQAFCLSLPLDVPRLPVLNTRRQPPQLRTGRRRHVHGYNFAFQHEYEGSTDIGCDDWVTLFPQYSTQWDALCHVGALFDIEGDGRPVACYYNGFRAGVDIVAEQPGNADAETASYRCGAKRLGVEVMAETCVQGRGVLIDLAQHFGFERRLVGFDDLQRVMTCDGVVVEEGDMVCLHTGFADLLLKSESDRALSDAAAMCCVLDGRDPDLLDWINTSGLSVLIADNYAIEASPYPGAPRPGTIAPIHELCLFKLGIHLGELWHLTPLAHWLRDNGRYRFLLTAPPLRLPGAAGSPVTPIATV